MRGLSLFFGTVPAAETGDSPPCDWKGDSPLESEAMVGVRESSLRFPSLACFGTSFGGRAQPVCDLRNPLYCFAMPIILLLLLLACIAAPVDASAQMSPRTRPERTRFEETSTSQDVGTFVEALQRQSALVHVTSFGTSGEGKPLPLVTLAHPRVTTPDDARRNGRPVLLLLASIHGGEVEGKEAVQHVMRRLAAPASRALLREVTILVAPIYNVDGNDRISLDNRPEQNGPIGGVGTRETAGGLDLNRDFMKAEAAETRALLGLLTAWDPAVILDLHTTNGSYHAYHLTWSPALSMNTDPRILQLTETLVQPVLARMAARGWRTHRYGNFAAAEKPDTEVERASRQSAPLVWRTYDPRPRFGTNYVGLRNRVAILSEAYSYLSFHRRVAVAEALVDGIIREVARRRVRVRRVIAEVDADTVAAARAGTLGPLATTGTLAQSGPRPVTILAGDVQPRVNPRSGREMVAMDEAIVRPLRIPELDHFVAGATRPVPSTYIVGARPGDRIADAVAALLDLHGIRYTRTQSAQTLRVRRFVPRSVSREVKPFQGHRLIQVAGDWEDADEVLAPGSLVVKTAQPLARVLFRLLEPESDDGVVAWNVMDARLRQGRPLGIATR
jgi:zinc carboxypeptidase